MYAEMKNNEIFFSNNTPNTFSLVNILRNTYVIFIFQQNIHFNQNNNMETCPTHKSQEGAKKVSKQPFIRFFSFNKVYPFPFYVEMMMMYIVMPCTNTSEITFTEEEDAGKKGLFLRNFLLMKYFYCFFLIVESLGQELFLL